MVAGGFQLWSTADPFAADGPQPFLPESGVQLDLTPANEHLEVNAEQRRCAVGAYISCRSRGEVLAFTGGFEDPAQKGCLGHWSWERTVCCDAG